MSACDDVTQIRWNGATFKLRKATDGRWHLSWDNGGRAHHAAGADAAEMLAEAICAAGFDEETKMEIFDALMRKLREGLFN